MDDYIAVQRLVAAHVGVALLPQLALTAAPLPDAVVLPVEGIPPRTVSAVALRGAHGAPATAAMLQTVREGAEELPGLTPTTG